MTIFRSLAEVPAAFGPSVVTIGNFDGVHVGHRRIMRRVLEIARARKLAAAVLTFDPHPARVLAPDRAPKLIMTVARRLQSIESEGIDAVMVLPFSLDFAKLTPEEFVNQILLGALHTRVIVVGEDFRFGHKQAGNVETLRALGGQGGFEVETIGTIERCRERVSSSTVRRLLAEGRVSAPAGNWALRSRSKATSSAGRESARSRPFPRSISRLRMKYCRRTASM